MRNYLFTPTASLFRHSLTLGPYTLASPSTSNHLSTLAWEERSRLRYHLLRLPSHGQRSEAKPLPGNGG